MLLLILITILCTLAIRGAADAPGAPLRAVYAFDLHGHAAGSEIGSQTPLTMNLPQRAIRSIHSTNLPAAKTPGLAAPALNVYTYGAEMDGAPDTNVWTLTTAPGVNVSYPNGTVAFQRGAETFNDWTPLAVLTARPRLNFTELAGTEAAWRITLGGQQQQALVYLLLVDGDADRSFEITCAVHGDGIHWNCHFTIRRSSDQAYLWWGPLFRATPVSQTPLRLGEYHTLAMRYDGGQQVTWLIDDEVALTRAWACPRCWTRG